MKTSAHRSSRCESAPRRVEPFTIRVGKPGTYTPPPKRTTVVRLQPTFSLAFRRAYSRGDLPVLLVHESHHFRLGWKVEADALDYAQYLPLFLDGLCEVEHPLDYFAIKGSEFMIAQGADKVLPMLPQLIPPIRRALQTRQPRVLVNTLRVLQQLALSSKEVGRGLVPYYRALLPTFNLFCHANFNSGDGIDYGQRKGENLGDAIQDTLQVLEKQGGNNAFVAIKYFIPTYESCLFK